MPFTGKKSLVLLAQNMRGQEECERSPGILAAYLEGYIYQLDYILIHWIYDCVQGAVGDL